MSRRKKNIPQEIEALKQAKQELARHAERQQLLLEATREMIGAGQDKTALARAVFDKVSAHLNTDVCFNYRIDSTERGGLKLVAGFGIPPELWQASQHLELGQAFCGTVAVSRAPLVADALRVAHDEKGAFVHGMGVRSYACHPLFARDGRVLGTLSLASTRRDSFDAEEVSFLQTLCNYVAQAWERIDADEARCQSEARLRHHVENAPVAVIEFDHDWRIVRWTGAAEQIFGWTAQEVLGKTFHEIELVCEDDLAQVGEVLGVLLSGGQTRNIGMNRNRHRDGRVLYCEWYNSVQLDAEGRLLSILSLGLDVTERKQSEEALRQANQNLASANAALAEADRRKDEFLAMLAHELRNPLAPVRNAVQVLRIAGPQEPILMRQRDIIDRQVTHMAHLVDDLLDVSCIMRGHVTIKKQHLKLADVLARAVETASPLIEARRHELTVMEPAGDLEVNGDPDRLIQVVGNLLHNAAKYTEEGGRIWLATEREGTEAVIRVRDTGVGLAPELLPRIFDAFTQAERPLDRSQGGLGLGLTLVRQLVQMHGGRVEARSEGPGRGSEFTVRLPAMPAPDTNGPGQQPMISTRVFN